VRGEMGGEVTKEGNEKHGRETYRIRLKRREDRTRDVGGTADDASVRRVPVPGADNQVVTSVATANAVGFLGTGTGFVVTDEQISQSVRGSGVGRTASRYDVDVAALEIQIGAVA